MNDIDLARLETRPTQPAGLLKLLSNEKRLMLREQGLVATRREGRSIFHHRRPGRGPRHRHPAETFNPQSGD